MSKQRECRDCDAILEGRRRYCDDCRDKRRQETSRRNWQQNGDKYNETRRQKEYAGQSPEPFNDDVVVDYTNGGFENPEAARRYHERLTGKSASGISRNPRHDYQEYLRRQKADAQESDELDWSDDENAMVDRLARRAAADERKHYFPAPEPEMRLRPPGRGAGRPVTNAAAAGYGGAVRAAPGQAAPQGPAPRFGMPVNPAAAINPSAWNISQPFAHQQAEARQVQISAAEQNRAWVRSQLGRGR